MSIPCSCRTGGEGEVPGLGLEARELSPGLAGLGLRVRGELGLRVRAELGLLPRELTLPLGRLCFGLSLG